MRSRLALLAGGVSLCLLLAASAYALRNNVYSTDHAQVIKESAVTEYTEMSPQQNVQALPTQTAAKSGFKRSGTTRIGVYNGPGAVAAHASFEQWLGKPVSYATDYIDYKGGWQKDFVDSTIWLMQPWGKWASATSNRRLVLGVPMLQNENRGQFDQGANGQFDAYFRSLGEELVKNNLGDSIIRLGYEANCDTIGPWQATDNPEGYKRLFRHEVTVMRSVPGSQFNFDWTVCNGLQGGHALTSFNSFYPGDDAVDILGMDMYDVKWQDPSASPQQRWAYLLNRRLGVQEFLQFADAHAKAISYPEWGLYKPGDSFGGGGDNPYFIQKMSELITSTSPSYQSYFNLNWGGGVLFDFSQGKTAFKQLFGS